MKLIIFVVLMLIIVIIVIMVLLLTNKFIKFNKKKLNEGMYSKLTNFIPSSKFTGSKKGYIFKMDKKGIGYYIDIKPVIKI